MCTEHTSSGTCLFSARIPRGFSELSALARVCRTNLSRMFVNPMTRGVLIDHVQKCICAPFKDLLNNMKCKHCLTMCPGGAGRPLVSCLAFRKCMEFSVAWPGHRQNKPSCSRSEKRPLKPLHQVPGADACRDTFPVNHLVAKPCPLALRELPRANGREFDCLGE